MSVVASPSEPARKTRVLSMSRVRSPVSFLVTKSPVRISRRWSPCGQPRVTGGVENVRTLRSIKRNLREKKGLDTESLQPFSFGDSEFLEPDSQLQLTAGCVENRVPPSLRDSQKWKGVQSLKDTSKHKKIAASQPSGVADFGDRCYPFHLNRSALPVLEVPPESVGRRHPYVTRALFQGPDVSLPTGVQVVGVYMECFADSEFDVSDSCFPEYVCCGLVSEFQDAVLQLEKVEVVVFSTGHILETFKSNCDFSEKFQFCSRHKKTSSQPSDVFYAGNTENPDLPAIDGSILSLVCGSNSDCDSDWSVHSEVLGAEESDSDWEVVQDEICSEDLPRLGLVEMDEEFSADPVAWQLADEYWTSATTNYSHETEFMGSCEEPVPDWFTGPYFDANASVMRPVDFLNQFLPQNLSRMVFTFLSYFDFPTCVLEWYTRCHYMEGSANRWLSSGSTPDEFNCEAV
ncbi:hypothetical protein R1sor_012193 [Riccia sorocarpa]|uniref:Uncharacterized protein n=1 Tax=Riccia sorocarpa TaxID=122646 RepID=A0ABD3I342_9MARC